VAVLEVGAAGPQRACTLIGTGTSLYAEG